MSEDEARLFLGGKDVISSIEQFKEEAWPEIKPFLMKKEGSFQPPESETEDQTPVEKEEEHHNEEQENEGMIKLNTISVVIMHSSK